MKHLKIICLLYLATMNIFCLSEPSPIQGDENKEAAVSYLWNDRTRDYLPLTAEWTNRVELADINDDGWVDLLFANGGNYSESGTLESSRVFLNEGPNERFREVTTEVFGNTKFLSRVIKVRDVNGVGIADIVLGTTYETQTQLYMGQGGGRFRNVTGIHIPKNESSIGDLEFGDVDDDGDLDIVLADWRPGNNMSNSGGRFILAKYEMTSVKQSSMAFGMICKAIIISTSFYCFQKFKCFTIDNY